MYARTTPLSLSPVYVTQHMVGLLLLMTGECGFDTLHDVGRVSFIVTLVTQCPFGTRKRVQFWHSSPSVMLALVTGCHFATRNRVSF